METIQLQREFETLIKELERLKNVNSLIEENNHTSEKVIDAAGSVVSGAEKFQQRLQEELDKNKSVLSATVSEFSNSIKHFEQKLNKQLKIQEEKQGSLFTGQKTELEKLKSEFEKLAKAAVKTHAFQAEQIKGDTDRLHQELHKQVEIVQAKMHEISAQSQELIEGQWRGMRENIITDFDNLKHELDSSRTQMREEQAKFISQWLQYSNKQKQMHWLLLGGLFGLGLITILIILIIKGVL